MKNKNQRTQNKNSHSFYNEAKNSFFGEKEFSKEKFFKGVKKYSKWALFGYLITATLWGCVNQFRNPTSQNVSQGIEFYRKSDEVWSNLYASQTSATYSVTTIGTAFHTEIERENRDNDIFDINTDDDDWQKQFTGQTDFETYTLEPLEFYVLNPHFYTENQKSNELVKDYDEEDWVDTQSFLQKTSEIQNKGGTSAPKTYAYQASDTDIYGFVTDIMLTDWEQSNETYEETGYYQTQSSGPSVGLASENLEEDIENASTWTLFFGVNDFYQDETKYFVEDEDEDDGIKKDPNGYSVFNSSDWYVTYEGNIPDINSNNSVIFDEDNFSFNEKINLTATPENDEEEFEYIASQIKYIMNQYAFNSGGDIDEKTKMSLKDEENKTALELYEEATSHLEGNAPDFSYNAILPAPLKDNSLYDGDIDFGNQLFIYAQQKGSPIIPTNTTIDKMSSLRNKAIDEINMATGTNYDSWDQLDINNGSGNDQRTNNLGWAVVDDEGEMRTVYDDNGNETDIYGLTRVPEYGHITNEMLVEKPKLSNYVLTEQNYNLKQGDYKIDNTFGAYLGIDKNQESIEFENQMDYLGMQNQAELGYQATGVNYIRGPSQRGTLKPIWWEKPSGKDHDNNWTVETYEDKYEKEYWRNDPELNNPIYSYGGYEGSSADWATEAIRSSGEDPDNKSRVTFASWSDWGRAWDPNFGPMHGTFVFPLAMVSLQVEALFPDSIFGAWGVLIGVFIIIFALRGIGTLASWKSHDNQQKMQEVQTKVAEIKARYEKYDKSNKQMKQKQQQETMALYKKHDVNPFASFGSLFLTMPIFLSMWTIISSIVPYKIASIGAFSFAATPFFGMFNIGGMFFFYLLIAMGVGLTQGVSSKLPSYLADKRNNVRRLDEATKAARKKQNKVSNIMIGVFVFMGLTIPTLLAFYWMISGLFTISLEVLRHYLKIRKADAIKQQ